MINKYAERIADAAVIAVGILILWFMCGAPAYPCGIERWKVKTLADADVFKTEATPLEASVKFLGMFVAPSRSDLLKADNTRYEQELSVYRVRGYLAGFKLEDDGDFHVVLEDESSTMVVEIPSPDCVAKAYKADMLALRSSWEKRFGKATKKLKDFRRHKITLLVEGYGFFDFCHGQIGAAPNCFELHPVISWQELFDQDYHRQAPGIIARPEISYAAENRRTVQLRRRR